MTHNQVLMNRPQIPKEKTSNSNNSIVMNHSINDSELLKSLSVETSFLKCDRERFDAVNNRESDNLQFGEHIYENVERVAKNKHRSLSEFVSNLKSKTKDLNLKKYAKILKPKMIDKPLIYETRSMNYAGYIDEDSYSPCLEENIYENLNFNFVGDWIEDKTVSENDALRSWLLQLSMNVEDYDSNEIMITKCIPSKYKNILCNFEAESPRRSTSQSHADLMLDQYKLDILNKCFTAIWKKETEDEILGSLYVFLNDIFSSYFIRNNVSKMSNVRPPTLKKRRKRPEKIYGTVLCKKLDKKTIQKLETFILSVTLNRLTITYDKCMKFYFALITSETRWLFDREASRILKYTRLLVIHNRRRLELEDRQELRKFLKTLKLILSRSLRKKSEKIIEKSSSNDVVDCEQVIVKEENIYQPIWKWHTDCKSVIRCEAIYTTLDFIIELDEQDWEVDSEFSFVKSRNVTSLLKENMFDSVCILYSIENPELNKIIYSNKSSSILNKKLSPATSSEKNVEATPSKHVIHRTEVTSNVPELDSVIAWKTLLRQSDYLEDEEDLIMSESQIESLITIQSKEIETKPKVSEESHEPPRSKIITTSNGSYELKSAVSDIPIIETSISGNYRQVTENDSITSSDTSDLIEEPKEEPKKEREKFRDKFRGFKLKSSKPAVPVNQETVDAPKEVDEDFFGSNLETVEKDSEHKQVPRIIVECIAALENNANLKTPGLYRVSGNKTVIEAFKKKSNDKKSSKKDSKFASLKDQDVHSVTGILKMFFRELTPPLMPCNIFVQCTSDRITLQQISAFLKDMPPSNYQTLKYLMAHLKRVELEKEENLMNSGNLAICFGLCIFSNSFDATNQFFENDISKCNMLCKKMIDYYGDIFKD